MDLVQWFAIIGSCLLLLGVFELVRRRLLVEEYAFVWMALSVALLLLSLRRELLDSMAGWLGIHYPPAVLLLLLVVFGVGQAIFFTVVMSQQQRRIERLIEDTAILAAQVRDLTGEHGEGRIQ
jgi:hypothetical protein